MRPQRNAAENYGPVRVAGLLYESFNEAAA